MRLFSPCTSGQISGFAMRSSGGLGRQLHTAAAVYIAHGFPVPDPTCGHGCRRLGSRKFEEAAGSSGVSPYQPGSQPAGGWNGSILPMLCIGETPVTEMYGCIAQKRGMPWAALCAIGRALDRPVDGTQECGCELAAAFLGVLKQRRPFSRRGGFPGCTGDARSGAAREGSRQACDGGWRDPDRMPGHWPGKPPPANRGGRAWMWQPNAGGGNCSETMWVMHAG